MATANPTCRQTGFRGITPIYIPYNIRNDKTMLPRNARVRGAVTGRPGRRRRGSSPCRRMRWPTGARPGTGRRGGAHRRPQVIVVRNERRAPGHRHPPQFGVKSQNRRRHHHPNRRHGQGRHGGDPHLDEGEGGTPQQGQRGQQKDVPQRRRFQRRGQGRTACLPVRRRGSPGTRRRTGSGHPRCPCGARSPDPAGSRRCRHRFPSRHRAAWGEARPWPCGPGLPPESR